jgi:hypothetical protein
MVIVVEAFHGGVLDGAVHPLDLSVCRGNAPPERFLPLQTPGMLDLGEPVLDAMFMTDPVEDVFEGGAMPLLVGKLDAVIRQHRMDGVGKECDELAQELCGGHLAGLLVQFDIGALRCPVDRHEEIELAFGGLDFSHVEVKVADRVGLEFRPCRLVSCDIRQTPDAMPLQAAVE